MSFPLYGTVFREGATTAPAAFLNRMRTSLPHAVDGAGGDYVNTSRLRFTTSGAPFEVVGDDDFNVSTSGGATFTTGLTTNALVLSGGTYPTFSARDHWVQMMPALIGDESVSPPTTSTVLILGEKAPVMIFGPRTAANSTLLAIPRGPQGSTLVSVHIATLGYSGLSAGTLTLPTYQVRRHSVGTPGTGSMGTLVPLSSAVTDVHDTGNWETDILETSIPLSSTHTFTPQSAIYQLLVTNPYNNSDSAGLYVLAVGAHYRVTQLRF